MRLFNKLFLLLAVTVVLNACVPGTSDPDEPESPQALCGSLNMFYCGAPVWTPDPTLQSFGWTGICVIGDTSYDLAFAPEIMRPNGGVYAERTSFPKQADASDDCSQFNRMPQWQKDVLGKCIGIDRCTYTAP